MEKIKKNILLFDNNNLCIIKKLCVNDYNIY